ncbi:acyl-ACP thioesterase domain-containing protein [Streptococcus hongkongensis]|nr:acyl-ACP thioesterase [Streptococcus uberis]
MGLIYKEELKLGFEMCDVKLDVKLPLLISYCLALSGRQTELLQMSDKKVLEDYHLVWIITDHEMTIDHLPRFGDTITIETEPFAYNKLFCYRRFTIYDQDQQQMAEIITHFALMNPATRKVAQIPRELVEPFESEFVKQLRRTPKIKALVEPQEKIYHVRYYDLDMNGHVNNGKYLDWVYDVMSFDFLSKHRPAAIQLRYIKEVSPDGTVASRFERQQLTTTHAIFVEGTLHAQAIIQWQEIVD